MGGRGFCMPLGASLPRGRDRGTSRGGGRGRERPSSSAADASDADDDKDIEDEHECGPDGMVKIWINLLGCFELNFIVPLF